MILEIFYWLLLIGWGALLLKYRKNVKWWTWNFVWAEHYLWNGGTYIILILIWLFMMFWWVLMPFWWLDVLVWDWNSTRIETK